MGFSLLALILNLLNINRQPPWPRLAPLVLWVRPSAHPPCHIFPSRFEPPSPCSFSVRSAPLRFYSVGPRFSTQSQRSSAILSLNINRRSPWLRLAALALGVLPSLVCRADLHRHTHGRRQVRLLSGERLELVQPQRLCRERVGRLG